MRKVSGGSRLSSVLTFQLSLRATRAAWSSERPKSTGPAEAVMLKATVQAKSQRQAGRGRPARVGGPAPRIRFMKASAHYSRPVFTGGNLPSLRDGSDWACSLICRHEYTNENRFALLAYGCRGRLSGIARLDILHARAVRCR